MKDPKIDVFDDDKLNDYIELLIEWSYINNLFEEVRRVLEKPYNYEDEIKKAILKEYSYLRSKGAYELKEALDMKQRYNLE